MYNVPNLKSTWGAPYLLAYTGIPARPSLFQWRLTTINGKEKILEKKAVILTITYLIIWRLQIVELQKLYNYG
jgi:hypothetical protein